VEAQLAAAFQHHQAGRFERAASLYRQILNKKPDHPDALHLLGILALREGRGDRAVQLIGKAVTILPEFAEAHSNLGNANRSVGRVAQASANYRRAIELRPDFAPAYSNLGQLLCEQGDFVAALANCRRAVERAPQLAEAQNHLGHALRGLGRLEEAAAALRRAVQLDPDSAARHINLGNVFTDLKRFGEAAACYRRAIELDPGVATAHYGLATCLRFCNDLGGALASYCKALALCPDQAAVWNDLGRALRVAGRFEEAVGAFRQALAVNPDFADAYRNLAACRQLCADGNEIARVYELCERADLPGEERAAAGFAMGKALDDADRFDEAFAAYDRANRIYRDWLAKTGKPFDAEALHQQIDETIAAFTSAFFASVRNWGSPSELPVFIVGMPRSGTSLVEQIAATHSQVFGAGELEHIGALAAELKPVRDEPMQRANVQSRAEDHLARLAALGGNARRVIDKLPDNIFELGVIAMLFPAARVIFCRRDPRDICLSCYFQKFTGPRLAFSYDLGDCAKRYLETERIMAHWHRVLSLRVHEVEYEALVADLEGESRRLIAFLGLEWEPACLEFHRTQRAVATASGWQVRQPLYDRSVGRWRNYEPYLAPLLDGLRGGPAGWGGARVARIRARRVSDQYFP
jgi:tetratricopeptide (TPR) repeat protein